MAPPLIDSKDGMLLYRELLRRFPLAQVEDYYKHGRWLTKHLETDLELVLAHRREAAAPEPVPLEKIPVPQLPGISRPPSQSQQGRSVPPSKPPAASTPRSTAANGPWTSRSKQYHGHKHQKPATAAAPGGCSATGPAGTPGAGTKRSAAGSNGGLEVEAPSSKRPRSGALPIGAPLAARAAKAHAETAPAPAARPGVLLPMKGKARPPAQRAQPQPKPAPAQQRSATPASKPATASAEKPQPRPAPKHALGSTAKPKPQPVPAPGQRPPAPAPKAAVGAAPPRKPAVLASTAAADATLRRPAVGASAAASGVGAVPPAGVTGATVRWRPPARTPEQPASARPAHAAPQPRQVIGGVAPRRAPALSTPGDLIKTLLR